MSPEGLRNASGYNEDGYNQGKGNQNVYRGLRHIRIEVSDTFLFHTDKAADQGEQDCHTNGRSNEVLNSQTNHL